MGMIGMKRQDVTRGERRKAFLKHAYERGFLTTYHGRDLEADAYGDDVEARMRYLNGARIGKRERAR